ncbi:MAG: M23 family metallopeptidase [bacterium]|nr:M23 family metallopeptidase [Planctomycetota bacterium]HIL52104.1 M23 family metallopeptidase [Planctomycetota bacterium]
MPSMLLCLLPLFMSQAGSAHPPAAAASRSPLSLTGAWELFSAPREQLILYQRADGRLLGHMAGSPGLILSAGSLFGSSVTLDFAGLDGGGAFDPGVFHGTLYGALISGTIDSGAGPQAAILARSYAPLVEELWLIAEANSGLSLHASRLTSAGAFFGGAFVGEGQCDFIACGGTLTDWSLSGATHSITTASGGSCPSGGTFSGTFDSTSRQLEGSYNQSSTCGPDVAGRFLAGKLGITTSVATLEVLELLGDFCDALEAESTSAVNHLHSAYLHDGMTRTDWALRFAGWFSGYDSITANAIPRRIITADDGESYPLLATPPRIDWQLLVTGVPIAGGAAEVLLDYKSGTLFEDSLDFLGNEGGAWVIAGNFQSGPLALGMPIAAGDSDLLVFGLWPFGVHGGGHPEGHPGIDIEYKAGAQVLAACDGEVTSIAPNSHFSGRWDVILVPRPGIVVQYDHMGATAAGIAVGSVVVEGQALGWAPAPSPHRTVHLGLRAAGQPISPVDYLSPSGAVIHSALWSTARYMEELVEPLSTNAIEVSFPLTASRSLVSGSLPARLEFTRSDAASDLMTYTLFDATDTAFEVGSVTFSPFKPLAEIDLVPITPGAATRLGVLDIQGSDLWIDWSRGTRPTSLAGASHYSLD